jgi:hypothetical protein
MNKTEVSRRPGWTAGRVEKFLVVEHRHLRRGYYGDYEEYEYSLPQILEAEKSPEWRQAAANYLAVPIQDLNVRIAELLARQEARRVADEASLATLREEWKAEEEPAAAKFEARQAELERLAETVRGGFRRIGCQHPLSDGWRTFEVAEVLEYADFADRRGRIDGDYIREFYRLWSAGSGYCNPKGVLRRIIAPVKKRLMRILLRFARRRGWVYGVGSDGLQMRVLYIDTPKGQVSFHLMPYEGASYPKYPGTWSGVRNSDQILIELLDSGTGRAGSNEIPSSTRL